MENAPQSHDAATPAAAGEGGSAATNNTAGTAPPAAAREIDFRLSELDLAQNAESRFAPGQSRRWITWRSVLLGFACVLGVSALTPYNDYVVAGTIFVGSYLPPILVLTMFILTVLVNAPLHRWLPRYALSSGELAVVVAMLLIGCSLPSSGCMRMLIPMLISPFSLSMGNDPRWHNFLALHLPHWLFPVPNIESGRTSHQVLWFINHTPAGESPPYASWIIPLLAWGSFIAAMFGTLLALAALLRPQWAIDERLSFPLAQLELALIEQPRAGRALNELLGSRMLWSGLLLSFTLQSMRALHDYSGRYWPEIPMYFNIRSVFTRQPWSLISGYLTRQTIYFTFVGIAFFIQRRAAFSLWSFVLICSLFDMVYKWQTHSDIPDAAWYDQSLGSSVAFAVGFLWIGRRYLAAALRAALLPAAAPSAAGAGERRVAYDNRWAARFALLGTAAMLAWLLVMGVQLWVAMAIVAFILLGHVVIARIVAETGLPFIRSYNSFSEITTNFSPAVFTGRDIFFAGVGKILGTFSTRESVMTYAMHGLQVNAAVRDGIHGEAADGNAAGDAGPWSAGRDESSLTPRSSAAPASGPRLRKLVALLIMSLLMGYVVSAAASVWCYYRYATPVAQGAANKINSIGLDQWPREEIIEPLDNHAAGHFPAKSYNPWLHIGIGAAITAALQFLSIRRRFWPLGPIGYLVHATWYAQAAWFSIFLGWLAKVLIVRFGGVKLFTKARPFFVGLIFGEALAAGVWLIVTLLLAWTGHEYHAISFLPT